MVANTSTLDFSAQFGSQDAADSILPHFRALKSAAKGVELEGTPFQQVAFILRVDGEHQQFGFAGADHVDIDGLNYVSVDIGVPSEVYVGRREDVIARFVSNAMRSGLDLLAESDDKRLSKVNFDNLRQGVERICNAYERSMSERSHLEE